MIREQGIREQRMRVALPVVVALGSNLGDREETLRAAVRELAATPGVKVLRASSLIETPALKPDGVDESAPSYLNAAVLIRTALGPRELLEVLQGIEQAHGRERLEHWGDRTLDLDIVSMGGFRVDEPDLVIPHPRAHERAFVLVPWLELEPDAVLDGVRIDRLLAALPGPAPMRVDAEPLP